MGEGLEESLRRRMTLYRKKVKQRIQRGLGVEDESVVVCLPCSKEFMFPRGVRF